MHQERPARALFTAFSFASSSCAYEGILKLYSQTAMHMQQQQQGWPYSEHKLTLILTTPSNGPLSSVAWILNIKRYNLDWNVCTTNCAVVDAWSASARMCRGILNTWEKSALAVQSASQPSITLSLPQLSHVNCNKSECAQSNEVLLRHCLDLKHLHRCVFQNVVLKRNVRTWLHDVHLFSPVY